MPKRKAKTPDSPLKSAVGIRKAKRSRKKKFKVVVGPGGVSIEGRPAFNTRATRLIGKAQKGQDLDRRHLVHYDEEIKPFGTLALERTIAKHGDDAGKMVRLALESRGCSRLPKSDAALFNRLITEVNSSVDNLVPDDASINKAIEIVRANLRKLRLQWSTDPEVQRIFVEMDTRNYAQTVQRLKLNAKLTLLLSGAGTDITRAIQAINKDMIEMIEGTRDIHQLYTLINDMQNSVTFDISAAASREKIAFTNKWRREREALELAARSGADNADALLMHLVGLITHY